MQIVFDDKDLEELIITVLSLDNTHYGNKK